MDNASFHLKNQIYELAQEYGMTVIFLPPYSPEYNPIEHLWNVFGFGLREKSAIFSISVLPLMMFFLKLFKCIDYICIGILPSQYTYTLEKYLAKVIKSISIQENHILLLISRYFYKKLKFLFIKY